jgi:hypothetical protein
MAAPYNSLTRAAGVIWHLTQIRNRTVTKQNSIFVITLLLALFTSISAARKSIEGHWDLVMVREGAELPVSFDFTQEAAVLASGGSGDLKVKEKLTPLCTNA